MLNFHMDLLETIKSPIYTPSSLSEQFPYQLGAVGHIRVGEHFFTERQYENGYQIIFTVSGNGILKYRNKTIPIEKNQAVLLHCNEYNHYSTGKAGFWEYKYMHLKGSGLPGILEIINQGSIFPISLIEPLEFNQSFDKIVFLLEKMDYQSDLKFPALLMNILTELAVNRNETVMTRNGDYHRQIIEGSFKYMQENYRHKLLIRDLAKNMGFNECYFTRLFKRIAGTTPHEYLMRLRIDKAKQILKQTDKSITDVAYDVGFENVNVFIRDFKKYTETTPLRYRNYSEGY
ncbi:AraC family transcriptional regulator [Paenibacillus psychroresistens]|uniref:AraC family transcriptional regulator n=1 Tax=Paenibacillus psychroresistens TaxID=1778678 RepID=A0A6B8RHI9_9BACL|nr:AraC family transcriptional regulator [Paenibacillus psychroresistens]QGQ94828.1 AraC family transcriptional regulator [Paenibacillus psychroresistens]